MRSRASATVISHFFRDIDFRRGSLPRSSSHKMACSLIRSITPLKRSFGADRHLYGDRVRAQAVDNHLYRALIRRTHAVHFVDKTDPRNAIPVGLAPDCLALRFDPLDGIKDDHTTIQHAQRALHFGGKIDMPRCIDEIDLDSPSIPQKQPQKRS
jgi:hypothetical protein